jgi:hypothetical protein
LCEDCSVKVFVSRESHYSSSRVRFPAFSRASSSARVTLGG